MAKRRRTSAATKVIRVASPAPRTAAPIIKVSAPRAAPARRKGRRRSVSRGRARSIVGGALNSGIDVAIGGAIFGFAVKQGWVQKLPAVPLLGRTGTAAILLHFWAKRGGGPMVQKAANAAATIAGYQLGSQGSITGEHFSTAGNADPAADAYYYADGDDDDMEGDDDDNG